MSSYQWTVLQDTLLKNACDTQTTLLHQGFHHTEHDQRLHLENILEAKCRWHMCQAPFLQHLQGSHNKQSRLLLYKTNKFTQKVLLQPKLHASNSCLVVLGIWPVGEAEGGDRSWQS